MNIDKASWHYVFVNEYGPGRGVPQDLCRYVRTLVIMFFVLITIGVGAGMVAICLLAFPLSTIHIFWSNLPFLSIIEGSGITTFGMTAWIAIIVVGGGAGLWELLQKYLRYRRGLPVKAPSPPGLLLEYYRATKNKVCPNLLFNNPTDEHEDSI